ncbi:MAG: AAA family ATPase [Agathobacter sp.]|nr:AAA family ATPase [Agathobacter sp.]
MKISNIRYGNFRNFEKEGEITFSTDGKVTIIYGTNGDGKTTLHQLFQWVLYGQVNFNKTTTPGKLYNLKKGANLSRESSMYVWGEIAFEHENTQYLVRREWEYYKRSGNDIIHRQEGDSFYVKKRVESGDWKEVEDPEALVEEVLPSGLAPYFFFDGETMIADLKIRGSDSAKMLKKALYSIFELEVYEKALGDIGSVKRAQSALGQLEKRRLVIAEKVSKGKKVRTCVKEINILNEKIEIIENENDELKNRVVEYEKRINEISELIGSNKSKKELENNRRAFQKNIEQYNGDIKKILLRFGKEIEDNYAYLLITSVVKDAEQRLYLQVQDEEKKIIPGLTKELLTNLLKNSDKCICGNCLNKEERSKIEEWKGFFPPASYKSTYDKFKRNAARYSRSYNSDTLLILLQDMLGKKRDIRRTEEVIEDIDKSLGGAAEIDDLLAERKETNEEIRKLKDRISENDICKGGFERDRDMRDRIVKNAKKVGNEEVEIQEKIDLLESAKEAIRELLVSETKEYSKMLMMEIQNLIDIMLTSKREVQLTEDFQLQVKDSYGDESKSEGQFAVISFAYIGGILKVLKSHKKLEGKEYPLILDGPFSKLDEVQKKNVALIIPKYAPQVIIFSKDPLTDFIESQRMGKVWTIQSNDEKNNATVQEGYLWN